MTDFNKKLHFLRKNATELPIYSSSSVEDEYPNRIIVIFTDVVEITDSTGVSINIDSVLSTISEVTGSGTSILTFIINEYVAFGDIVDFSYNASIGNLKDSTDQNLVSITTKTVTNNVLYTDIIAPTNLTTTSPSPGNVQLFWDDNSDNEIGFKIERKIGSEDFIEISRVESSVETYLDGSLTIGDSYSYRIRSYNATSNSSYSNTAIQVVTSLTTNCHYIREGATGSATGADWTNAWTDLPVSFTRGHTYYVASGTYGPHTLSTAESDTTFIFIKKATVDNHGTNTGWDDSYATGQAVFQNNLNQILVIARGYWDIDGQTGTGTSGHGLKFYIPLSGEYSSSYWQVIQIIDPSYSYSPRHFINIRHCEIQHVGAGGFVDGEGQRHGGRGIAVHSTAALRNSVFQYCYIHDIPGVPLYYVSSSRFNIVEYCHVSRDYSDAISHGEGIQTNTTVEYLFIRYSTWEDIEGTAILSLQSTVEIYGNIFYNTPGYPTAGQSGSGIGMGVAVGQNDIKIYNNTSYNLVGSNCAFYASDTRTGNNMYNNIWVNCDELYFYNITVDYNFFYNNGITAYINGGIWGQGSNDAHKQDGTEDPFTDSATFDFTLSSELDEGMVLPAPYDRDMNGNIRGSGGVWSRGAFQKSGI